MSFKALFAKARKIHTLSLRESVFFVLVENITWAAAEYEDDDDDDRDQHQHHGQHDSQQRGLQLDRWALAQFQHQVVRKPISEQRKTINIYFWELIKVTWEAYQKLVYNTPPSE